MIHGDKDEVVPFQQGEVIGGRLKEVGVPAKLIVVAEAAIPGPTSGAVDGPKLADWFDQYFGAAAR